MQYRIRLHWLLWLHFLSSGWPDWSPRSIPLSLIEFSTLLTWAFFYIILVTQIFFVKLLLVIHNENLLRKIPTLLEQTLDGGTFLDNRYHRKLDGPWDLYGVAIFLWILAADRPCRPESRKTIALDSQGIRMAGHGTKNFQLHDIFSWLQQK